MENCYDQTKTQPANAIFGVHVHPANDRYIERALAMTLYNLHTDGDHYRITKFVDGNVESSYLLSHNECECPAGSRPTCRHRQMLPSMLSQGIANTHWFWDRELESAVDINGDAKAAVDAVIEPIIAEQTVTQDTQPAKPWRRL